MSVEVQNRLNVAHESGYRYCGSAVVAAILPKPLHKDLDLLALVDDVDTSIELLNDVISVGLFRQGYMPMTQLIGMDEDVMGLVNQYESRRMRNLFPHIEYFGTVVYSDTIGSSKDGVQAISQYVQDGGYDIRRLDFSAHNIEEDVCVETHVIAIPATYRTKGARKYGYVDTNLESNDENEPAQYRRRRKIRVSRNILPENPVAVFDDAKGIVCLGMKFPHYLRLNGSQTEKRRAIEYYRHLSHLMREKSPHS